MDDLLTRLIRIEDKVRTLTESYKSLRRENEELRHKNNTLLQDLNEIKQLNASAQKALEESRASLTTQRHHDERSIKALKRQIDRHVKHIDQSLQWLEANA